jgi:ankyrin repeat protein
VDLFCETAPFAAAKHLQFDAMLALARSSRAVAQQKNRLGRTLMHIIADFGRLDVMRALVSAGTPSDIPDHMGETPLSRAAAKGHAHVIKYLVGTCGAVVDRRHGERNPTVLHRAAQRGLPQAVAALLDVGASLETADADGVTPVQAAASSNNWEVVAVLLSRGASATSLQCKDSGLAANVEAAAAVRGGVRKHAWTRRRHLAGAALRRKSRHHALAGS